MFTIYMVVDGNEYAYGTYENRNRANEIAMQVRESRNVEVYVAEG